MPDRTPSLARPMVTLFSGTVLAQFIPFLAAPLIARSFTAPQFALFGAMMAVFNVLNVMATGRYEMAVVLPHERNTASDLVRGAVVLSGAIAGMAALAMLVFQERLANWLGVADMSGVTWVLAALVFMAGAQMALQQWLLRNKAFGSIASVKVLQAVVITAGTILLGQMGVGSGLILGYLIGWGCFFTATAWVTWRRYPLDMGGGWPGVRGALWQYRAYPLHNAWPAVMNALASGMAVLYMSTYFPPEVAGQYNFARQYMLVPIGMFTTALGQVMFERTASKVREGRSVRAELLVIFKWLVIAAAAMCVLLFFAGEALFSFVFGEHWAYAGAASRWLIWGYAAQLVASPFGLQLLAIGRVRAAMIFPLLFFGLMLVPLLIHHLPPMRFMILLSTIEVVAYGAYAALVWHHIKAYESQLARR